MKKWLVTILLLIVTILSAFKAEGQTITQTYIDPCDNKVYVVTIPFGQNQTIVVIRGKSKIITLADISSGAFQKWVNDIFSTPCTNQSDAIAAAQAAAARAAADAAARAAADAAAKAASDAAAKAAADAAARAAAGAASNAASGAASSAASGAASNAASGAASSAAASAATPPPINVPPPPPVVAAPPPTAAPPPAAAPPPPASGSSSSSPPPAEAKPAEAKPAEAKPADKPADKPAEQKQEEKKTEAKTEEKKEETKTEEKKSEEKKTEEKKEEAKKEEEKKEEEKKKKEEEKKKKQEVTNPLLLASDIAGAESADGKYLLSVSLGVSKSSLAGDVSYSAGLVVNSDLSSIVTTGGITKMEMKSDGNLNAIHSYGTAFAYLGGNYMNLMGYTWIKPTPKRGTYGYNVGIINLFLKNDDGGFTYNMASSLIVFWTKPYVMSKKLVVSPQVFTTFAPLAWNSVTKVSTVNRHMGFLVGAAFDYKISKRFGFSFNYKVSSNTASGTPFLSNFLVGSRMML
jgi:hypothetical protein